MVVSGRGSDGGPSDASVDIGRSLLTAGEDWGCETRTVKSSESVVRSSSDFPSSRRICEENSSACGTVPSAASVPSSSSPITPFNASRRLVIRGDRLGDIGGSELGVRFVGLDEASSPFSVGTEEGRRTEDFGTLILTWCKNEQESENIHLPCE